MARVTVEDCNKYVPNSFELVVLAALRAQKISSGAPLLVNRDNDKNTVVALREIGEGKIDIENLRESLITSFCQVKSVLPQEQELEDLLDEELASTHYITEKLFETSEENASNSDVEDNVGEEALEDIDPEQDFMDPEVLDEDMTDDGNEK